MNKELRELLEKINNKKAEARNLVNAKKLDEAQAMTDEIKNLQKEFDINMALFEDEKNKIPGEPKAKADEVTAFLNALRGKPLTDEMKAALVTSTDADGGYLVPKDINTKINELKRQYKSAKDCCTSIYPTSTKSGTIVYEDLSTLTELVNFDESGAELDSSSQPKFVSKSYSVKNYGAILPISNVLLQDEAADLVGYIGSWFARKAIRTENARIFAALKNGLTPTAIADWKDLKAAINTDLDPIIANNAIICTNQDGFNVLDAALDAEGRPVLQPDPTNPTVKRFMGKVVEVFSNTELPTVATKAPIFFGALGEGVKFVDRGVYEMKTSDQAGFTKNQTLVRCIERFDVIQADTGAYVYGEFTIV